MNSFLIKTTTALILMVSLYCPTVVCELCEAETNNERSNNGNLPALGYNEQLEAAAKTHNDFMISSNCLLHECSGESDIGSRISNTGYAWSSFSENIAAGASDCAGTMAQWMNSEGHRANLLGNYINFGCAEGTCGNCDYPTYWTCVYASPS